MYSFDIFDTLITRITANPKGVFAIMQERLISDKDYFEISSYIRLNFAELRINAEAFSRKVFQSGNTEDISLETIYNTLGMDGALTNSSIEKLMELEKDIEYQNSIGIAMNIDKVKRLILSKEKVVLISDMYLDKETIQKLLIKADPIFKKINIYVSSEYKKTKSSGNLFWVVKKYEQIEFSDWTHFGDNVLGDYQAPSKLGITAKLYQYQQFTLGEKKHIEKLGKDPFVQLTIGTARNARLFHFLDKEAAIGASIGGVVLFPYVYWLLQKSLEMGIRNLYFIARDGYVLKKMADIIINECKYPISTKYIYGSRRAWRVSSFNKNNHDIYKFLSWSHINHIQSLSELADVFQLTEKEILPYVPEEYRRSDKLSLTIILSIKKILSKDEKFCKFLCQKHMKIKQKVIRYLKENIDFLDENIAFVDVAGSGYTQACLAAIISDFYKQPIKTFYLKMDSIQNEENCKFYNFLPNNLYLNMVIELLCRAPHGQTVGYAIKGEKMIPVIEEAEGKALKRHGILEYIGGIEKFTEEYIRVLNKCNLYPVNLTLLLEYMSYITQTPDQEILEFFGGMPFSATGREKEKMEFAPKLSYKDITNIFLKRTYEPIEKYYKGTALGYSVLRCSKRQLSYLEFCKRNHGNIIGKVSRLKKNLIEGKYEKNLQNIMPLELLKSKIVIYAAGNVGQSYYKQLKNSRNHKIVLWIDMKWEEFRILGMPVSNPLEIQHTEYDQIVVAVADDKMAENIKNFLIGLGVNEDKIIWF